MDISGLSPFRGLHSSLMCFSSGHAFRISDWNSTPTEYGALSNLWMVTPEDHRVLSSDPAASSRVVRIYHSFDEVHGASISIDRPGPRDLRLSMQADNGTTVEMSLRLRANLATRLLLALSRGMPTSQAATNASIRLAEALTSAFVARGKVRVAGKTDTGQPYFGAETEQLLLVNDGTCRLDGAELGRVCPTKRTVAFGDFQSSSQAYLMVGALYLAYQKPE